MNLNPSQEAAVTATAPIVAVAAGPGSGKSRCLVERIQRVIRYGSPKVVAITFTNAGAHVMSERLKGTPVHFIGTLHAYCFRLIQQHAAAIGYRAGGVNLITEETSKEMLEQVAKDLLYKGSFKALNEKRDAGAQLCWREYAHRLRRNNLVDFDTVLEIGLDLIKGGCGACDWLFVDECQDSAEIDWQIYYALVAANKFFVGDGDQSIYAFRGAYPSGFIKLCQAAGTELIRLEENYRSSPAICRAATALIRHNEARIDKDVIAADPTERGSIFVREDADCLAERRRVAATVANLVPVLGPNEIAVICRTNFIRDQFREALRAAGVPVAATDRPQLPSDWAHGLNCLSLMLDSRNDFIAEKVIGWIRPSDLAKAKKAALEQGQSLSIQFEAISSLELATPDVAVAALPKLCVSPEMHALVRRRRELLPQPNPTLADLVQDLFSHAKGDTGTDSEPQGVSVITAHSAKGREFEAVFLPAFEDEIWSPARDKDEEESRRLAFVAVTRARAEVYVSHARTRQPQWGNKATICTPSRFIREAGL